MDQKFLGLGFTFGAIDDGLKNMFRSVSNAFHDTVAGLKGVNEEGAKATGSDGFLSKFTEFAKLGALGHISGQLQDLKHGLLGKDAADASFETLERFQAEMQFTGKMTTQQAAEMRTSLLSTATATGALPDQLAGVVTELLKSGVATDDVNKNMKRMGELMGAFGLDAHSTSEIMRLGLTEQLGMNTGLLDGLVKKSVAFSQAFGMPPDLKAMPKILEAINKEAAFKNLRGKAAEEAAAGIQQMSVMFQQLGKGPEAASDAAIEMFSKMKGMEKQFDSMTSGLEGQVDDFYKSVLITGPKSALKAMQANDPTQMFASLREAMDEANKRGPGQAKTMRMWIENAFGPDIARAVGSDWGKIGTGVGKALTIDKKGVEKPYDSYMKLIRKTVTFTNKLADASEQAMKIQLKFATSADIQQGLMARIQAFKNMTNEVVKGDTFLAKLAKTAEIFEKTGLGGVLMKFGLINKEAGVQMAQTGASFSLFGESVDKILMGMAAFGIALTLFKKGWEVLRWAISPVEKLIVSFGRAIGLFTKVAKDGTESLGIFAKMFEKFKGIIPGTGIFGKLKTVIVETFTAGIDAIKWSIDAFRNFGKNAKATWETTKIVWLYLKDAFRSVKESALIAFEYLKGGPKQIIPVFKMLWEAFKSGSGIAEVLFGGLKMIGKGLGKLLGPIAIVIAAVETLYNQWGELTTAFGAWDSKNILESVGRLAKVFGDFALGMVDSILFNLPSKFMGDWVTSIDGIQDKFMGMVVKLTEWIKSIPLIGNLVSNDALQGMKDTKDAMHESYLDILKQRKIEIPESEKAGFYNKAKETKFNEGVTNKQQTLLPMSPLVQNKKAESKTPERDFGFNAMDLLSKNKKDQTPLMMQNTPVPKSPEMPKVVVPPAQVKAIEMPKAIAPKVNDNVIDFMKAKQEKETAIKEKKVNTLGTTAMSPMDKPEVRTGDPSLDKQINDMRARASELSKSGRTEGTFSGGKLLPESEVPKEAKEQKMFGKEQPQTSNVPAQDMGKVVAMNKTPRSAVEAEQKVSRREVASKAASFRENISDQGDIGSTIANAIAEGFSQATMGAGGKNVNVTVVLQGDARKLFRVQNQMMENEAASRGTHSMLGG